MVKDERAKVMLDPSLLLVERSFSDVANNLHRLSEYFSFHISRHFYDILIEGKSDSLALDYFSYTSRLVDVDRVELFLDENSKYIQMFEMPEWASREYKRSYELTFRSLPAKYRYEKNLHNVIFEEWFFLKEKSWLVARTKRLFNMFIRSGAATLEYGSRVFDNIARMPLRSLPRDHSITNAQRLRGMAKWIAFTVKLPAASLDPRLQALVEWVPDLFFYLIDP